MTLTSDEKWNAVVQCDSSYDRLFFYGVKTTGIFCRPSCKSKEPRRNNVQFFDAIEQAYAYGLRPCKRCRPDLTDFNPSLDLIERAKYTFDTYYDDRYKLAAEIKGLGISHNYLIHLFRKQFNITPVEYTNRLRVEKAAQMIKDSDATILSIALMCGFGSLSTFYELFKKQIGFTPKEYRKQGICVMISNDNKCQ